MKKTECSTRTKSNIVALPDAESNFPPTQHIPDISENNSILINPEIYESITPKWLKDSRVWQLICSSMWLCHASSTIGTNRQIRKNFPPAIKSEYSLDNVFLLLNDPFFFVNVANSLEVSQYLSSNNLANARKILNWWWTSCPQETSNHLGKELDYWKSVYISRNTQKSDVIRGPWPNK